MKAKYKVKVNCVIKKVRFLLLFNSLTLRTRSSVEIFEKMPQFQQQTSTCRRQKSDSFYSKFSVEWNELTPNGSGLKIAKTKECSKNLEIRISRSKGQTWSKICGVNFYT